MNKKTPQIEKANEPNPKYELEILQKFPGLVDWLGQISRYGKFEDFIFISDYKENNIDIKIYTKNHYYRISAVLPARTPCDCKKCKGIRTVEIDIANRRENDFDYIKCNKCGNIEKNRGYLGCVGQTRKARAGEDWLRGNDLADGSYSKETWQKIKNDILAYELVKVVRNSPDRSER